MSKQRTPHCQIKQISQFRVYYQLNQTTIQLNFNDSRLRVSQVIVRCIKILQDKYMINVNSNPLHYALYPANKKGYKLNDSTEITHGQRIKRLGFKNLYLEYLNLAKDSISTDINFPQKQHQQKKDQCNFGYCCSFKF